MAKKKIINIANEDILPITDISCIQGLIDSDNGKIKSDLISASASGGGTIVSVNKVEVNTLEFTSDPQTQLDKHTADIKTINETIDGINDIQDLSLTREFTTEEVANGAVVGSICEVERINGKSEVSKNLWNEEWELGLINYLTGVDQASTELFRSVGYTKVNANQTYKFISPNTNLYIIFYDSDYGYVGYTTSKEFEIPENTTYLRLRNSSTSYGTTYKNDIALVSDLSVDVYTPYYEGFKHLEFSKLESNSVSQETTIENDIQVINDVLTPIDTINYGDTILKQYDYIYGVKKYSQSESVTFNGSESWIYNTTYDYMYLANTGQDYAKGVDVVSTSFNVKTGNQYFIVVYDSGFTNATDFKTYLATNPLTIVYQTETLIETYLNIFPYLNIINNGNLTFDSNLSVNNTIIYPLNTKSEVARLSSLVGKLDNEIVELRSENESLAINLAATKEELDNVSEYFTTTSMSQRGETGTLESSDLYPASASLNIGKGRNVLSVSVSGNVNYTSSYNTATGIYSFSISSSTASVSFTASVTYALKDINDFIK